MNNSDIDRFVQKVMAISTGYPGIGDASSGIIGSSGTNGDIDHDLRNNVIAFATEYAKAPSNTQALEELSSQLMGSFLSLKIVGSISDAALEELSSELKALVQSRTK